jgi:hypothetical protein
MKKSVPVISVFVSLLLVFGLSMSACTAKDNNSDSNTTTSDDSVDDSQESSDQTDIDEVENSRDYGDIQVQVGKSDRFSEDEILAAIDVVVEWFNNSEYCEVISLWYDQDENDMWGTSYMEHGRGAINGVARDNLIIINSEFITPEDTGNTAFDPSHTYYWRYHLIRDDASGTWRIDDFGY